MKNFLLSLLFSSYSMFSFATIFDVTVSNFQFTPANIPNVKVGDVVRFTWSSGFHTTTCDPNADNTTSLPAGANTWDAPMTNTATTFSYTVTTPGVYNYVCKIHSPNMNGSFTASAALPVILTSFNATKKGEESLLRWSTSSEENTSYFSITKSFNGKDYDEVGRVPASGNSTTLRNYSYTDHLSVADNHQFVYYLLAIVDKDGRKNYSSTVLLKGSLNENKIVLSVTPNPVPRGGHIMVDFNAAENGSMTAEMFSEAGQSVLKTSMSATKGVNMGHIHIKDVPAGSYTIKFTNKDHSETFKILIK